MYENNTLLSDVAQNLLTPFDLDETLLFKTLNHIRNTGVDDADIYLQQSLSESWSLEEGIVKTGSWNLEQGLGVRSVVAEKSALAYADTLSPLSLKQAADSVVAIANAAQAGTFAIPNASYPKPHQLYSSHNPLDVWNSTQKTTLLREIEAYTRTLDTRVSQVMISLHGEYERILVARSDGVLAGDIRPLIRFNVSVIVESQGRRESGYSGGGARMDYNWFSLAKLHQYAKEAVSQALLLLDAKPAPAGLMTVVLGSGWPGVLLHEAVGHGLEADFNRKGTSLYSGKIGQQVAAKGVTVVDDGTIPDRRGSLNVDDEGTLTQRNTLIENGILVGYISDRLNARLMKTSPTGNGRRESFAHLPMPRMTNTFMESGQYEHEEIIASVKNGIYAENFGGGQVDITNGKFVFSATQAWKIENGKITYPLKGATLIGSGPEVLKKVSMIGNNLQLDGGVGTCGKDGQSVPVGVGQPSLKIDEITVGGRDL
jgi:TldD protein